MIKKILLKNIKSTIMRKQGPPFVKKIAPIIKTPIDQGEKFRYESKAKSIFFRRPDIEPGFKQEAAAKFARGVEASKLKTGFAKIRKVALKQFKGTKFYTKEPGLIRNIYNPKTKTYSRHAATGDPFVFAKKTAIGKRTIARIDKAKIQAVKTARAAGLRALQKRSEELNVGIKKFTSRPVKARARYTEAESRELGFAPREISAEMKSFYSKGSDKAGLKRSRATLSKLYKTKKTFPKRSQLIQEYRIKAKSQLAGAKIQRKIDLYSKVEKFNPKTKRFETFRTYDIKPIDPVASFYRNKRKK